MSGYKLTGRDGLDSISNATVEQREAAVWAVVRRTDLSPEERRWRLEILGLLGVAERMRDSRSAT